MAKIKYPDATHAFVGYAACGKVRVMEVDEGQTMRWATKLVREGGRIERIPIEAARQCEMCFGCEACNQPKEKR